MSGIYTHLTKEEHNMTHLQSIKTALIMSSLLLLTPCVQAMDNFYVGAQGGLSYLSIGTSAEEIADSAKPGGSSTPANTGGIADLFIGYRLDTPYKDVFAAIELDASGVFAENKITGNDPDQTGFDPDKPYTSTDKIDYNIGLSMKVGRLFDLMNHKTNAYLIFGGGIGQLDHSVTMTEEQKSQFQTDFPNYSFTLTEPYLRGGIGLSQEFAQHLSWQVEYDYYYYNSFNKNGVSPDTLNYIYTYKPKMQALMGGITYTF